jgi:outer membrane lipoprotein-sorting protein
MLKLSLFFSLLAVSFATLAQYPGYSAITDLSKFRAEFSAATQKIVSIKSDFVQEKNLAMLSEKIISKGKFWFKRESQVRMEYIQPFTYLMILNKDKVFIKDGQKENKVSTRSNKLFQQINRIMVDCMQGTALDNHDFTTRVFVNKNTNLVELTPLTKELKQLLKAIVILVDRNDFSVVSIDMLEVSGDNTLLKFSNKEMNATISDALFAIK